MFPLFEDEGTSRFSNFPDTRFGVSIVEVNRPGRVNTMFFKEE